MAFVAFLLIGAIFLPFNIGLFIENTTDILQFVIPTVRSNNAKCRNHSRFYLKELESLKLWAAEMFDASSKFPSGVLYGSSYDLGNFDECVEIKVPFYSNERVSGKYCIAKFNLIAPESVRNTKRFYYGDYEVEDFSNISAWEKITDTYNDRSRAPRNEFYLSYCIPSSCHYQDLKSTLTQMTNHLNSINDFKINIEVDAKDCQTKDTQPLSKSDIVFLVIIAFFILATLTATFYDWLIKIDELKAYELTGRNHEILISFSIWSNLKKLAHHTDRKDRLQCINGLKVYSMFLIIMGHRIMFQIGSPILNANYVESMYGKVETTVLLNGPIIVDTFFNISGFLACYLMLQDAEKLKKGINFVLLYLHRFIRLTPAYAVVLGFYCTLFIKTGSGPFWRQRIEVEQERCVNSWWTNLLYINNYVNKDSICMFQSWYMTCDMHFFLATPLIVWLLLKHSRIGLGVLFSIILLSISIVFSTVYINNEDGILLLYMKLLRDPVINDTFKNIYIPTHMRASPYFVGILTGYVKYKMQKANYSMPRSMVYMGWIMCILVIETTVYFAFIFYVPGQPYNPLIAALYSSLHHFTWSICISWMIIAITEGNGSWVEPILGWRPLALLSRITYTAFLCHGAIQIYSAAIRRHPHYASIFNLVFESHADIALSYIAGLFLSMIFEAPVIGLERIFLRNDKKKESTVPSTSPDVISKVKMISRL